MKRILCVVGLINVLIGCADSATTKAKVDSTVTKIDSTASAVWDSTKERTKAVKEGIDSALDKKTDSKH